MKSPGVATVSGAALTRTWDKRKGYGTTGASLVYSGEDLGEFAVTFEFWDWPTQRAAWIDFAKRVLVKEPTGSSPKALRIEHWQLNDPPVSIDSVVVKKVGQPEQDDYGLVTVKVDFSQFRSPKAALGKPTSTKVPGTKKKQPTAKDAADEQIEKLTKQFKEELAE